MTRRLVAVLPCRCNSTRLWGKPLQALAPGLTVCEYLVSTLLQTPCVSEVCLAIAQGAGSEALVDFAEGLRLPWFVGSERDVLGRVLHCAREAGATDVLHKTSEDPFLHAPMLELAWQRHVEEGNDVTALDLVPEGAGFAILTTEALARCSARGSDEDHEHIANYARFNQSEFAVAVLLPEACCRRMDLRLTVDNPEDLILCRAVHRELAREGRPIPLSEIVDYLDRHPGLVELVRPFVDQHPIWMDVPPRESHV